MLQIYNSSLKEKQIFAPRVPGEVSLYVCGITVYDHCHIGHARMFLCFDTIVRYFKHLGYRLKFVRNITDVDDKIIEKALKNGEPYQDLAQRYIESMHEDCSRLGLILPSFEPKATEYIEKMIVLIKDLIQKGYAYVSADQNAQTVYYSIRKFKGYGLISGQTVDDLLVGARIDVNEAKQDPLDFVLWKSSKPGEPAWNSPWGPGRPGWHSECAAMALDLLGAPFDVHGGGPDLKFPHHENERCQAEASVGCTFVNYWVHTGYLNINAHKMSKSLENFVSIKACLQEFHPEVLRYFMLQAHYRGPLDYNKGQLENAKQSLSRLYTALDRSAYPIALQQTNPPPKSHYTTAFLNAMNDDFNTPKSLAVLFEMAREINKTNNPVLGAELHALGKILGLFQQKTEDFMHYGPQHENIETMIEARRQARAQKNWEKADEIRTALLEQGIVLEDHLDTTGWKKV